MILSIVSLFFDSIECYSQFSGFVSVCQQGENGPKYGIYDSQCNQVVPCMYDYVVIEEDTYVTGPFPVQKDGKFGYVAHDGKLVIPCIYEHVGFFHGELALVSMEGKFGMIDRSGKLILPCIYDVDEDYFDCCPFSYYYIRDGVAIVQQGDIFKVVNAQGEVIIPNCLPSETSWSWILKLEFNF